MKKMPSSHWNQIELIIDICRKLDPTYILDVGCGFGKFGFLLREYLDVWDGYYQKKDWNRRIDAVEIYSPYIGDIQKLIYNFICHGSIRNFLNDYPTMMYDLVLMIDVIEHMFKGEGEKTIKHLIEKTTDAILIVTPKKWYPQGSSFRNINERHLSYWKKKDFRKLGKCQFFRSKRATIVLINAKVPKCDLWQRIKRKYLK